MRDLFTYPKPPFATAKRWRPPHPSLVLFAVMFMAACGGGGGGSPASKPSDDDGGNGGGGNEPDPTIIVITPAGEDAKPLKSAEGALLPEKIDGTSGGYKIGTLSDNNDGSGNVTYALDNPNFRIDGKVLYYIGADSGYFEAMGTLQSYGLKIVRKDGDNTPETFDYVVNLQNVIKIADIAAPEAGLYLRPVDDENLRVYDGGDSFTENADGTDSRDFDNLEKAVLPKGADGSSTPVALGTFAHDTKTPTAIDGDGDGTHDIFISYHYSLAANSEGNLFDNLFSIEDNQLSYIGTADDIRPTFLMSIATSIKVTINLPDGSYYNLETDGRPTTDAGNINDHKFALNGGGFSDTKEVAEADVVVGVAATGTFGFGGTDYMTFTASNTGTEGNITLRVNYVSGATQALTYDDASKILTFTYSDENLTVLDFFSAIAFDATVDLDGDSGNEVQGFTHLYTTTAGSINPTIVLGQLTNHDTAISGGMDAVEVDTAHRTIDVDSGRIYVADTDGDGSNSKIILFNAVDDLRIDATSFVIVTDKNNDGMGEVEAATEAELKTLSDAGTDFYVLGAVDATKVPQMLATASLLKGDTTNGATFTADEAGAEGNDIKLVFAASGNATGGSVVATLTDKTITITYDGDATLADLAGYTLPDAVAALIELETAGAGDLSAILGTTTTGTTESLTGGLDAYETQTITIGNVDVTLTAITADDVVIKSVEATEGQSNQASASIATADGVTTVTVLYNNVAGSPAKTSQIITALNTLDGVSAALASGATDEDANDNFRTEYQMTGGDASTQGSVNIGGLTITAANPNVNYKIFGTAIGTDSTAVGFIYNPSIIATQYGSNATLEDLKDFIDTAGVTALSASITDATAYGDGSTLLTDIFGVVEKATPEVVLTTGDAPTANPTATADNKFTAPTPTDTYQWETFGDPQTPEDFTILGPDIL